MRLDIHGVLAFSLAFGASLSWGAADFLAGLSSRRLHLLTVLFLSQAIGLLVLLPALLLVGGPPPGDSYVLLGALAGVFNAAALAAFYRGLAVGPMGVVAPIVATDAVIPVVFGQLTGERLAGMESLGMGLALAGVVLVSRTSSDEEGGGGRRGPLPKGVGLALVAALCFGCYVVALDGAAAGSPLWAVAVSRVFTVGLLGIAFVAPRAAHRRPPSLRVPLTEQVPLAGVGVLDVGASLLFAAATTAGLLSQVGVLGSLYPVMTILLARVVLRERLDALQRLGSAGALAGAALIAAG